MGIPEERHYLQDTKMPGHLRAEEMHGYRDMNNEYNSGGPKAYQ